MTLRLLPTDLRAAPLWMTFMVVNYMVSKILAVYLVHLVAGTVVNLV